MNAAIRLWLSPCRPPHKPPPVLVPVVCMGRRAVAVVDQIHAVAKERLTRHLGEISLGNLASVEEALRIVLEL